MLNIILKPFLCLFSWFEKSLRDDFTKSKYSVLSLAIIGSIGHPIYYLWWTFIDPRYENIYLRIFATISCITLFFEKKLNSSWRKFFPVYWFFVFTFNFPFFFTFQLINDNFSLIWSMSEVAVMFFAIMLFRHVLLWTTSIIIGIGCAVLFSLPIAENAFNINAIVFAYFPVFIFVFFSASIVNYSGNLSLLKDQRIKIFHSLSASIAHELRGPLNNINLNQNSMKKIIGNLGSTLENIEQSKNNLNQVSNSISTAIKQANETINIILADLSEKPINPHDFSYLMADQAIAEIVKNFGYNEESEREKVKIIINNQPIEGFEQESNNGNFCFKAVPERFTFIVYNLLKNALYYLKQFPNSIISIGSEKRRIEGKEYNAIYVHDTGPGVPPEIMPKLFGSFFTSGKKGGTGLGLDFCKRNMQIFNGDIICESYYVDLSQSNPELNKSWTKFLMLFPELSEAEEKEAAQQQENQPNQETSSQTSKNNKKTRRVLIVDDQQSNLIITKLNIEHNLPHISCAVAKSGFEALDLLKKSEIDNQPYDLILMDIDMPGMDGITTSKKIRELTLAMPIIANSSRTNNEDIKASTNDYIKKPSPNHLLSRTIMKWLIADEDDFAYLSNETEYLEDLKGKRIILADDQLLNRMVIKNNLQQYGLNITEASNGKEMVEIYQQDLNNNNQQSSFDLIITDINMPVCNGYEAVSQIRSIEAINNVNLPVPIIAISGENDESEIKKFFASQINDYFTKGSNPEWLIKIIAIYLSDNDLSNQKTKSQTSIGLNNQEKIKNYQNFNPKFVSNFTETDRKNSIKVFLQESLEALNKIKTSYQNLNLRELLFHLHGLKGSSGTIGAEILYQYIVEIEKELKQLERSYQNSGTVNAIIPEKLLGKNWIVELNRIYQEMLPEIETA